MAQDVIDVILGEAKGGDYNDMLHVASAIVNRAKQTGTTVQDVVRNSKQFNAYGKALPAGVNRYRKQAEAALRFVTEKGPVTPATYYATPEASKNLPKGLEKVTSTDGHEYYVDPQNRPIVTASGTRKIDPSVGLLNLAPSMLENDGTVKTAMADPRLDNGLGEVTASLTRGGFGDIGVKSGFRTRAENRAVGGAGNSQHLYGRALDLGVKDLPTNTKADILDRALMGGAKGIGLYNSGAMHVDSRSTPTFWGPNGYRGSSVETAPDWAKPMVAQNMANEGPYLPMRARNIPVPTPRDAMANVAVAQAEQSKGFDRGGILDAPKVSLNPVSSAQAGEMPQGVADRIRPMPTNTPRKTSNGMSYSLAQPKDIVPQNRPMSTSPALPMSTPRPQMTPISYQNKPQSTGLNIPSGLGMAPQAPANVPSPDMVKAAYQQYGATRAAAPAVATNTATYTATGAPTTPTQIAGPLSPSPTINTFPAAPSAPTFGQKVQGRVQNLLSPENLQTAALAAAGSAIGGPMGGILGGLVGRELAKNPNGGLLSGLMGGGAPSWNGERNYLGGGVNNVERAMYGRGGDTATYRNASGGRGGTITNLGNGSYQRTSERYGWTETVHPDGRTSISYSKDKKG